MSKHASRWRHLITVLILLLSLVRPAAAADDPTATATCISLDSLRMGTAYSPGLPLGPVNFQAERVLVGDVDGHGTKGISWSGELRVTLPASRSVSFRILHGGSLTVKLLDNQGQVAASQVYPAAEGAAGSGGDGEAAKARAAAEGTLQGRGVVQMTVSGGVPAGLTRLCYVPTGEAVGDRPAGDGAHTDRPEQAGSLTGPVTCIAFANEEPGDRLAQFTLGDVHFDGPGGTSVLDLTGDGATELYFSGTLTATFPETTTVQAVVVHYGGAVQMTAANRGPVDAPQATRGRDGTTETLSVTATGTTITSVTLTAPDKAALLKLCYATKRTQRTCDSPVFQDVQATDPACAAIRLLVEQKIASGFQDNTYRPNQPVTRAEMAKLLVSALGQQPEPAGDLTFTDTAGHWAGKQGYLQKAVQLGFINGYPDRSFKPNTFVTRAQALRMVGGADPRGPQLFAGAAAAVATGFRDVGRDAWFGRWVWVCRQEGLLGEAAEFPIFTGTTFSPDLPLTRGEAAQLVANLLLRLAAK